MLETPDKIIFPQKVLFKSLIQEYPFGKVYKPPQEVKNAKFTGASLPLRNEHFNTNPIGEVTNLNFDGQIKGWKGDVLFFKEFLTGPQLDELKRFVKADLSIGFEAEHVPSHVKGVDYDQKNLLVDHVAWVLEGRCSSKMGCGLKHDSAEDITKQRIFIHDVFVLTECEDKDKLIAQLQADKATLESKVTSIQDALNEKTKAYDSISTKYAAFEGKEKENLIKEIMAKSKYTKDSLDKKELPELNSILEIIKQVADTGDPPHITNKDPDGNLLVDPNKSFNMMQLYKAPSGVEGGK